MKKKGLLFSFIICTLFSYAQTGQWETITTSGIIHRHENSFVECGGKFYLLGGRRLGNAKHTNIYNPQNGTWSSDDKEPPIELHHFQAICYNNKIYVIGAFTGGFPNETPVPNVYIYDPANNSWTAGAEIPVARRRGAAGAVIYNNKIYIAGGATDGHNGGYVAWFDVYDPSDNSWTALADAPHARDHFQAAVAGNKLFLTAGRRTSHSTGQLNNLVVNEVDVFDFSSNSWSTWPNNIPTGRAGTATVALSNRIIVMGGEGPNSASLAHNETEALNINSQNWQTLAPLQEGRHGTHALVYNDKIYIASGCRTKGGSGACELTSMEEFTPSTVQSTSKDKALEALKIFPNPATDNISIISDNQRLKFEIINYAGVKVMEGKTMTDETQININALDKGLYIIRISADQGEPVHSVLISKH
ncbi:MAG: kelch repeat-containing protein [Cytophagaceae bacterium]